MSEVIPQVFMQVEKARCPPSPEPFDPDNIPVYLSKTPLGHFEVRVNGKWYRCRGSYMSSEGPMVWREVESIEESSQGKNLEGMMPHIPRLFCSCGSEMRCAKTGVSMEVFAKIGSYYKIQTDRWACPACGTEVYVPASQQFAEHFHSNYSDFKTEVEGRLID